MPRLAGQPARTTHGVELETIVFSAFRLPSLPLICLFPPPISPSPPPPPLQVKSPLPSKPDSLIHPLLLGICWG
jgi:hypothetical protein